MFVIWWRFPYTSNETFKRLLIGLLHTGYDLIAINMKHVYLWWIYLHHCCLMIFRLLGRYAKIEMQIVWLQTQAKTEQDQRSDTRQIQYKYSIRLILKIKLSHNFFQLNADSIIIFLCLIWKL